MEGAITMTESLDYQAYKNGVSPGNRFSYEKGELIDKCCQEDEDEDEETEEEFKDSLRDLIRERFSPTERVTDSLLNNNYDANFNINRHILKNDLDFSDVKRQILDNGLEAKDTLQDKTHDTVQDTVQDAPKRIPVDDVQDTLSFQDIIADEKGDELIEKFIRDKEINDILRDSPLKIKDSIKNRNIKRSSVNNLAEQSRLTRKATKDLPASMRKNAIAKQFKIRLSIEIDWADLFPEEAARANAGGDGFLDGMLGFKKIPYRADSGIGIWWNQSEEYNDGEKERYYKGYETGKKGKAFVSKAFDFFRKMLPGMREVDSAIEKLMPPKEGFYQETREQILITPPIPPTKYKKNKAPNCGSSTAPVIGILMPFSRREIASGQSKNTPPFGWINAITTISLQDLEVPYTGNHQVYRNGSLQKPYLMLTWKARTIEIYNGTYADGFRHGTLDINGFNNPKLKISNHSEPFHRDTIWTYKDSNEQTEYFLYTDIAGGNNSSFLQTGRIKLGKYDDIKYPADNLIQESIYSEDVFLDTYTSSPPSIPNSTASTIMELVNEYDDYFRGHVWAWKGRSHRKTINEDATYYICADIPVKSDPPKPDEPPYIEERVKRRYIPQPKDDKKVCCTTIDYGQIAKIVQTEIQKNKFQITIPVVACTLDSESNQWKVEKTNQQIKVASLSQETANRELKLHTQLADLAEKECLGRNRVPDLSKVRAIATVPDGDQMRVEATRPQLIYIFREYINDKWGEDYYPIRIYHPKQYTEDTVPRLSDFQKGQCEYIWILKDNSKLIVNAFTQISNGQMNLTEAERIMAEMKNLVKPEYLQGTTGKPGLRKGNLLKQITVKAWRVDFYSNGIKNMEPDFTKTWYS